MEKDLEDKIRGEVYELFTARLKGHEEFYQIDREIIHYFSFEAPIGLLKGVKDNFNYDEHFSLARYYWVKLGAKDEKSSVSKKFEGR